MHLPSTVALHKTNSSTAPALSLYLLLAFERTFCATCQLYHFRLSTDECAATVSPLIYTFAYPAAIAHQRLQLNIMEKLVNELLINIIAFISATSDLCAVSLVSRRFRGISQETLHCSSMIAADPISTRLRTSIEQSLSDPSWRSTSNIFSSAQVYVQPLSRLHYIWYC